MLKLLNSAESNAKNKGYNVEDLRILHLATQRGPKSSHYGRKKRSVFKNSHLEVVLEEIKGLAKNKNDKRKSEGKSNPKSASKSKSEVKTDAKTDKSEQKSKSEKLKE